MTPEPEELERLAREERAAGSVVARIHRVLVPVRRREAGDEIHTITAVIRERMGRRGPLSLTLFNVAEPDGRARSAAFLDRVAPLFAHGEVTRKIVEGRDPEDAILDESEKFYDLVSPALVVNASWRPRNRMFERKRHDQNPPPVARRRCGSLCAPVRRGAERG